MCRHGDEVILVNDGFLGQHAIDTGSGHGFGIPVCRRTIDPVAEIDPRNTIAAAETRDARTDRNHLPGTIRDRDWGAVGRYRVQPPRNHEVAVVERDGMSTDAHLALGKCWWLVIDPLQRLVAAARVNPICLHG